MPYKLKDQYCFKTEAAVECLKFLEGEQIVNTCVHNLNRSHFRTVQMMLTRGDNFQFDELKDRDCTKNGEEMNDKNELVLFETKDNAIKLDVPVENETVWLTHAQMIELFDRDQSVISRHITNSFKEQVDKESNMQEMHIVTSGLCVA